MPEPGAGGGGMPEIGQDAGVVVEEVAAGVEVVTVSGDRQRHYAGHRVGQLFYDDVRCLWAEQVVTQRAHNTSGGFASLPLHDGEQAVLGEEDLLHAAAAQTDANLAPVSAPRAGERVEIDGLMGAMESAHPQMHDGGTEQTSVVCRHIETIRELSHGGVGQLHVVTHSRWFSGLAGCWPRQRPRVSSRSLPP